MSARRPLFLLAVMLLCSGALVARLTFWQVMEHGVLSARAAAEHPDISAQPPVRGRIFDDQGNPLAANITMNLVYAVPKSITDPARTAQLLAPILGQKARDLQSVLTGYSTYALLAPEVNSDVSKKIQDLALPGIVLTPQLRRAYPEGSLASHELGFVLDNNHGAYGLEGQYDALLSGAPGLRTVLRDTAGNTIPVLAGSPAAPRAGADLYLSLDATVQNLVETELHNAVKKHSADGGTIIVMDPRTGFILGMASTPTFDPNHFRRAKLSSFANPAIQDLYEPGSTFKIVTMAAGLDAHVITPKTAFQDTGVFRIADQTLHNWNMSGFGWETMTQVLQHSANVGAAWVASRLGTDLFYKYINRFHLSQPTGIDLQGEQASLLPLPGQKSWTIVNQYTNAFGQGLAITPMQMIRAVATVANGGVMMKPQLVRRVVYDGQVKDRPPVSQGRVISAQTARTLTGMLVRSAIGGEAQLGLVPRYNVAAKTGTASIALNGRYIQGATIASIVGYAPAFKPRFVILVKIDHPRDTPWGSLAAAPVLHDLLQELLMYYHVPPATHTLVP
jgi:cell division protein FtsI (penicillin-binding protein 3)